MRCSKLPWLFGTVCLSATLVRREWSHSSTDTVHSDHQSVKFSVQPWDNRWDIKLAKTKLITNSDHVFQQSHNKLLIFVRHGQYHVKAKTRDEKVLTELGWKQAYECGRQLKRSGIKIDRIIHSDMIRARQTTAALLMGLQDDCDHLFDHHLLTNLTTLEQFHLQGNYASPACNGSAELNSSSSDPEAHCQQMLGHPYQPYSACSFDCQQSRFLAEGPPPIAPEPPIGKPLKPDLRQTEGARLEEGFQTHIHHIPVTNRGQFAPSTNVINSNLSKSLTHVATSKNQPTLSLVGDYEQSDSPCETIVFVGHANVFRYWLCRALQLPPEAWLRISLYHGSISSLWINYEPGSWVTDCPEQVDPHLSSSRCVVSSLRIGEISHLPKELMSR